MVPNRTNVACCPYVRLDAIALAMFFVVVVVHCCSQPMIAVAVSSFFFFSPRPGLASMDGDAMVAKSERRSFCARCRFFFQETEKEMEREREREEREAS
ncbi:hypothetical protein EDD21DRAFT_392344, partial [Dissophora ornata]